MNHDADHLEESIFAKASELTDPQERGAYLDRACVGNEPLRRRIDRLLEAEERADAYLDPSGQVPGADDLHPCPEAVDELVEGPGTIIGRYKLLEKIGEGGFGIVYMAEQEEPVRRKVALKIIKLGMDTRQVIARFEAERQALAAMDHPHIAKVLDAGATQHGRPYFVMELVRGASITEFCDQKQLKTRERLQLFISVCRAIHHAHRKGIVHRDIKPSNILVSLDYGEAAPKVIDFGIAKALNHRLTEKTLFTRFAQMIGTPAYMSPEQAELSNLDIDTRTDVYSLGILLYELLTGTTPFPEKELLKKSYAEIQRIVCEVEPERPSTRLDRLGITNRVSEVEFRQLRGDLDWVVLKAIDKDRRRRYDTPGDLVGDLRRFLNSEPVNATPPSTVYRLRKFAFRNKVAVTAGLFIAFVVVLGASLSIWQAIRATKSEDQARQSEAAAEEAQEEAEKEAATAKAILAFLQEDLLALANPFEGGSEKPRDRDLKLLAAINLAAQGIGERFQNQPLAEAGIRLTLAKTYSSLGEADAARPHLERALKLYESHAGTDHLGTWKAREAEALWFLDKSEGEKAVELIQPVVEARQRLLGLDHNDTIAAMRCLAASLLSCARNVQALQCAEEAVQRARRSPFVEAETLLGAIDILSWAHSQNDNVEPKIALAREAFDIARERLGEDHPKTIFAAYWHASCLRHDIGEFKEAERSLRQAHERSLRVLGEEHPTTLSILSELAVLTGTKGFVGECRRARSELLEITRRAHGAASSKAVFEQMRLGTGLQSWGYLEEAEELLTDALKKKQDANLLDTVYGRYVVRWLSRVYLAQGRYAEAEEFRRREVEVCKRRLGPEVAETRKRARYLANICARQGKWTSAATLYHDHVSRDSAKPVHLVAGLLASALAGKSLLLPIQEQRRAMLERLADADDPQVNREVARTLLLVPGEVQEIELTLTLAERALVHLEDPSERTLLAGMAAARRGNWQLAQKHLAPLVSTYGKGEASPLHRDVRTAVLAGFFQAMSVHQQGQAEDAREWFDKTNNHLERLLRSGDLGNSDYRPGEEWTPFAAMILARREADALIHGQPESAPIDADYLRAARKSWKPVKALLDQADWSARGRDWAQAGKLFHQAMRHERFDWEAAVHQTPSLPERIAALFVLTEDWDGYTRTCRRCVAVGKVGPSGRSKAILLDSTHSPPPLQQAALTLAQQAMDQADRAAKPSSANQWRALTLGMAEYRNGHFQAALTALNRAEEAYRPSCSGAALAVAALASWELGREQEARGKLAKAEDAFNEIRKGNPDDLGPNWQETAIFEIFLREARERM